MKIALTFTLLASLVLGVAYVGRGPILTSLAAEKLDSGHFDEAERIARRAGEDSDLAPETRAHAYLLWGYSLDSRGDHNGAMAKFRESVMVCPNYAKGHKALGDELSFAGRYAEAEHEFEEAWNDGDTDPAVYQHWKAAVAAEGNEK